MPEPIADPAFKAIPKNSTFFFIWRIEKLQLALIPKENYGSFYSGDSYIVAVASDGKEKADSQMKPRTVKQPLDIRIHFWLGEKTSQDEAGVAAYKTVELDNYLGGAPVQHREVQGYESTRFLSYFRNGLRILEGGVASGFHHVEQESAPKLFHVKGKRIPIVKQCEKISWASMNKGDVFILDAIAYVFLWNGETANHMEKIQGAKVAQQLKAEHGSACKSVVIIEDGNEEKDLGSDEKQVFELHLPLSRKGELKEETSDVEVEKKRRTQITLYRCTDENDNFEVIEVKKGPLFQGDLNSNDSFIVDNGENGIWVWIGKKASKDERTKSMKIAEGFIEKKNYPSHTPVTRVIDGGEPIDFKSLFKSWRDYASVTGFGNTYSSGGHVAKEADLKRLLEQNKFDFSILYDNTKIAAEVQMVDDGSGEKKVYRVKNFDLIEVPESEYGIFFSGDCYLIVYKYFINNRENAIIYYWIGNSSTPDEKGTVALKAIEIDNTQLNGRAVQVRVIEGKEPPHFSAIFGRKIIIFRGGFQSGFHNRLKSNDKNHVEANEKYLLQVRRTNKFVTRAIEVECSASSLNSNDTFILYTPDCIFLWAGKGSIGDEREAAKSIASKSENKEIEFISEGQEKDDFWNAIGGRKDYANDKALQQKETIFPPRLFQCSNAKGLFTVEEIFDFQQTDLVQEDVMLLDASNCIFIWIGNLSNEEERKQAIKTAHEYLETDPRDRDPDTPIIIVKQGYEPLNFTGFFGAWNHSLWANGKSNDSTYDELAKKDHGQAANSSKNILPNNNPCTKYPIEVLRARDTSDLPEDVDPLKKE
ncbi:villin-1-like protein, partial [Dinothrombium tinctorium]